MTPLAVAATIVAAIVISYRLGARRRPAPRPDVEARWAFYRCGWRDAEIHTIQRERTPSPN